ncbi:uncharacterized protein AMSG_12300 [Thecamonas trahens ATCC 50062]|uniref:Uncharacterized protein n=1 Tax=Thecamonas trahens ATCC 50062 TaxID=461836 RepID=A0A0L0DQ18_THETB|nr:hypothetical protein AMSG_12300 [Thecamonas trahens ATCC 50062]KNC54101.1 hypothetical protein AMSG_12300 [Thecamonas trahens ATCC 50062]|eukprot:XP_013754008.1 hypothetical protein AMSG_12300 [Thecamonas trahens ATCC 50062]
MLRACGQRTLQRVAHHVGRMTTETWMRGGQSRGIRSGGAAKRQQVRALARAFLFSTNTRDHGNQQSSSSRSRRRSDLGLYDNCAQCGPHASSSRMMLHATAVQSGGDDDEKRRDGGGGGGHGGMTAQEREDAEAAAAEAEDEADKAAYRAEVLDPPTNAGFLHISRSLAPKEFARWKAVVPLSVAQACIGSVYAWSIFNEPLTRVMGGVASAASDWDLSEVIPIFSASAISLGLTTFVLGAWVDRVGPRKVVATAASLWGSGLLLSAAGVATHTLPLVYAGYGVLGGAGWGLGYIAPVHALMKWFPERRGLATGLALTTFGGGAIIASPLNEVLLEAFFTLPTYLGAFDTVETVVASGVRMADVGGALQEVVVASEHDVAALPGAPLPGVYQVGTGSSGVAETFAVLGVGQLAVMLSGALMARVPHPDWKPPRLSKRARAAAAAAEADDDDDASSVVQPSIDADKALRTPQFYLFWTAVFGNAVAGVSVISSAKTVMTDCFSTALPSVVHGGFAATYVAALSAGNMAGRLGWATASDGLGRKATYALFGVGIPMTVAIPHLTSWAMTEHTLAPLALFYASTVLIVSFYGGVFSVLPAYLSEVFGPRNTGAIHGRMITAWASAAVAGPAILSHLRSSAYDRAVTDLTAQADPATFEAAFGAPKSALPELIDAKTVTVSKLLDILPESTPDPTPALYNDTFYVMGGFMTVAFLCNALIHAVRKPRPDRNGKSSAAKFFFDPRVCKWHLLGLCPHDALRNTKRDLGECPKTHSDVLKREYEKSVANGERWGYEFEHMRLLRSLVRQCDGRIHAAKERMTQEEAAAVVDVPVHPEAAKLHTEISEMVAKAAQLGSEGKVTESRAVLSAINEKKNELAILETLAEKEALVSRPTGAGMVFHRQQLRVCEVCAGLLSLTDSDVRLAAHFKGRMHFSLLTMREMLKDYEANPPPVVYERDYDADGQRRVNEALGITRADRSDLDEFGRDIVRKSWAGAHARHNPALLPPSAKRERSPGAEPSSAQPAEHPAKRTKTLDGSPKASDAPKSGKAKSRSKAKSKAKSKGRSKAKSKGRSKAKSRSDKGKGSYSYYSPSYSYSYSYSEYYSYSDDPPRGAARLGRRRPSASSSARSSRGRSSSSRAAGSSARSRRPSSRRR